MSEKYLTSYLAHLNHITPEIRQIQAEMGERCFPCVLSNDIPQEIPEWPRCSPAEARVFTESRVLCLCDPDLAFFFIFTDKSERNEIAAFELGLAIQNPKTTVVILGARPKSSIHCVEGDKIIKCYDFENFLALRFP